MRYPNSQGDLDYNNLAESSWKQEQKLLAEIEELKKLLSQAKEYVRGADPSLFKEILKAIENL